MNEPLDEKSTDETIRFSAMAEAVGPLSQLAPRRRVLLLLYHRDGVEAVPLVAGSKVVVGREPPSDIVIADKSLSRRHARFSLVSTEEVVVEDLGSTNGTKVSGQNVERAALKPGEQVMLGGTIKGFLHVVTDEGSIPLGLDGHDVFRGAVEAEIGRARFFGRSLAVLVVQPRKGRSGLLPQWCPGVRRLLRAVDRIALYSAEAVEILLPEAGLAQALELGKSIVESAQGEVALTCGIALFPGVAASAEELVEASRDAARLASAGEPVRAAESEVLRTVLPGAQSADAAGLVLKSPSMRSAVETAGKLARSSIPVLLHGENGSGKEVISRLIHESGPRRGKPLICVNCGAIASTLVESTLFGHEKGAFTGADRQHKGVFEAADGGTLLLDEIGELSLPAQAVLLRVLEGKRVTRVGSTREIDVDVRVIAATHRDLEAMCVAGTFRQDLYYRTNAMVLTVPPLRARREDVADLTAHFLELANRANDREIKGFDEESLSLLEQYAWPGNVRELRNAVERAVVIADGDWITARDLPERVRARGAPAAAGAAKGAAIPYTGSIKDRLARFEREMLIEALREAGGSQTIAAKQLKMPHRTFQHKVKTLNIKKVYGEGEAPEEG